MSEIGRTIAAVTTPARMTSAPANRLQRACACGQHTHGEGECADCRKKREAALQRAAAGRAGGMAPPIVHEVLRSTGQPLDSATCAFMEPRFGHDFSQVRVHTGPQAAESAQAVNALAYTVGRNVVFGPGQYAPRTSTGQRLLAHELTHTIQQNDSSLAAQTESLIIGPHNDRFEIEAGRAAGVASQPMQPQLTRGSGVLQRQTADAQPQTSFDGCNPDLQADLRAKHQPALEHVNQAIASLAPGWARMDPVNKSAFSQYFDPANSGDIDQGFVRDVQSNFRRIHSYMRSLRFDCDPHSWTACGTSNKWCVGGRLMWTCFGNLHVCTNAYPSASESFKIETIIHESTHNALLTTDRAYSNQNEFSQLRPRGGGFLGRMLNILSNIPVLGILFRSLPGNNDTINNPDSYAGYAMQAQQPTGGRELIDTNTYAPRPETAVV
jgi:hypothetical protein